MTIEILDPTYDESAEPLETASRAASLAGLTVGIVSNGKQGTTVFFDAVEAELRAGFGVADVVRVTKSNYSAPADRPIMDEALRWHALIAGIGD